MSTENQEAQEEELLALSSIYPEDEFKRSDTDLEGEVQVCLELPPDFKISIKSNSATNVVESFEDAVFFLPPIVLNFELPPGYPSSTSPTFTLSCKWLSPKQLTLLCQRLDYIWEENRGSVVLFAWMRFLKEETLEYLNIKSPYEIQLHTNGTNTLMQTQENSNCCSATVSADEQAVDSRAIQDVESVSALVRYILDFNESQQKKCFDSKPFLCNICFCEKLGSECTHFKNCSHVYCNSCLRDYFEIQIRDGQVHALNCPEPKCTSVATPGQVKELVGEELFSRYDRLLLQSSLDRMTDVVYCPRLSCQTAVMQEPEGTMGVCSSCQYAFCTVCWMTYHGVSPCQLPETSESDEATPFATLRLDSERLMAMYKDYMAADKEQKIHLQKRYGKRFIQKARQELKNRKWLKQNSKPCPHCGFSIQKNEGCNKMMCTACNQYFCWVCMKTLAIGDPYGHFNDPGAPCALWNV